MKNAQPMPLPGASFEEWTPYALAFNGYDHAGSYRAAEAAWLAACGEIERTGTVSGSYEHLRTALFFHQRMHRDAWLIDETAARVQHIADALLAALAAGR